MKWKNYYAVGIVLILIFGSAGAYLYFSPDGSSIISNIIDSQVMDGVKSSAGELDIGTPKPNPTSTTITIQDTCENAKLIITEDKTEDFTTAKLSEDSISITSKSPIATSKDITNYYVRSFFNETSNKTEEIRITEKAITLTSLSNTKQVQVNKELLCMGYIYHIGETSTIVQLDYTKDLADIYYTGPPATIPRGSLIKWDITSIPAGATIDNATLCLSIRNKVGSPGTSVNVSYLANQSWVEGVSGSASKVEAMLVTRTNYTTGTLSSDTNNTLTCVEVITQLQQAYGTSVENFTINLEIVGGAFTPIGASDTGLEEGVNLNRLVFNDRENYYGGARPTLNISYTPIEESYPAINLDLITPEDLDGRNVTQNAFFNVTAQVCCDAEGGNCGEINVSGVHDYSIAGADYVAANCDGQPDGNGNYYENGTWNSKPAYSVDDGLAWLSWDGGAWVIYSSKGDGVSAWYYNTDSGDTPPTGTYTSVVGPPNADVSAGGGSSSGYKLINITTGATPFYTTDSNPYNVTLNAGDCANITWDVNATGEIDSTSIFFAYANMTSNETISNITSSWNVTIEEVCQNNITNSSWSDWTNITCIGGLMNQSRFYETYDSNFCGNFTNETYYEYRMTEICTDWDREYVGRAIYLGSGTPTSMTSWGVWLGWNNSIGGFLALKSASGEDWKTYVNDTGGWCVQNASSGEARCI